MGLFSPRTIVVVAAVAAAIYAFRTGIVATYATSPLAQIGIYVAGAILTAFIYAVLPDTESDWRGGGVAGLYTNDHLVSKENIKNSVAGYEKFFGSSSRQGQKEHEELLDARRTEYTSMVNHFYDLVTDFYEYGWCESFHFGPRYKGEAFIASIHRAEYYLALRVGLKPGMTVVDVGAGIGGPMRSIARHSGATVIGINNNDYQIKVGTKKNEAAGLAKITGFVKADFCNVPVADNTYDAGYAIEATCHAPDKYKIYGEIYRLLKPGATFGAYEWVMTDSYDEKNPRHVAIREGIEVGNSLPHLDTAKECVAALKAVGFEILDNYDANRGLHRAEEIPWYDTLNGRWTLDGFRMTTFGRRCTNTLCWVLETLRIAPKGAYTVAKLLDDTAYDLVDGGKLEIFTPSFFFLVRKPLGTTKPVVSCREEAIAAGLHPGSTASKKAPATKRK